MLSINSRNEFSSLAFSISAALLSLVVFVASKTATLPEREVVFSHEYMSSCTAIARSSRTFFPSEFEASKKLAPADCMPIFRRCEPTLKTFIWKPVHFKYRTNLVTM